MYIFKSLLVMRLTSIFFFNPSSCNICLLHLSGQPSFSSGCTTNPATWLSHLQINRYNNALLKYSGITPHCLLRCISSVWRQCTFKWLEIILILPLWIFFSLLNFRRQNCLVIVALFLLSFSDPWLNLNQWRCEGFWLLPHVIMSDPEMIGLWIKLILTRLWQIGLPLPSRCSQL